ncbi:jg16535 [Pararge aegeria aegeria]|uniref:Jg16535 protein n=1 Tax=Pararge aegeria aegeria TaxID=348720 RepID=A0A8S4SM11_9NEOP|nr:jg16535 [Pararge aegeria aegeria]
MIVKLQMMKKRKRETALEESIFSASSRLLLAMEAMRRKAPSRRNTNALEGQREEGSRFELDLHSSMARAVEDVEGYTNLVEKG